MKQLLIDRPVAVAMPLLALLWLANLCSANDRAELLRILNDSPLEPTSGSYQMIEVDASASGHVFFFETSWDGDFTAMRAFTVLGKPEQLVADFQSTGLPQSALRSKFLFLANDLYSSQCRAVSNDYDSSWTIDSVKRREPSDPGDFYRLQEPYCSEAKTSLRDVLEFDGVIIQRRDSQSGRLFSVVFSSPTQNPNAVGDTFEWDIEFSDDSGLCVWHQVRHGNASTRKDFDYRQLADGKVFIRTIHKKSFSNDKVAEDFLYYFGHPDVNVAIDPDVFYLRHYGLPEPSFSRVSWHRLLLVFVGLLFFVMAIRRLRPSRPMTTAE